MKKYKNILFDLDNTLLDFNMAERIALIRTLEKMGAGHDESVVKRYSELNKQQWQLLELGKLTRSEVKIRRFKLLFEELLADLKAEEAAKIYENNLAIGHYFMKDAIALLETIRRSGSYRMYLVTNGTKRVQESRIASAGIGKYFDGIFISEEMGANKPSKEYFDKCFKQIGDINIEETVIIGDSISSDILGGINAGISTIWFNPYHEENSSTIKPDIEIDRLCRVAEILGEKVVTTRTATPEDVGVLLDIYRPYVEKTAITFEYEVPSVEEFAQRIRKTLKHYPYIILEENGVPKGYAYASRLHERKAYDWAVEASIYVDMDSRKCGYGAVLYSVLEDILKRQNILSINACIAYAPAEDEYLNNNSMEFHEHIGYSMVGRFHQCGYKFSRWYDMIWMEKMLGEHDTHPEEVIDFEKLMQKGVQ